MHEITAELGRFVAGSRVDSIPPAVIHEATRAFVNWFGCVLGGCSDPLVAIVESALAPTFGDPQATIIGRRRRVDAPNAALINCLSSCVHGFDDTHAPTIIHPTGPVASALLGAAEGRTVSGATLLHALVLGVDVECRVGNALIPAPAKSPLGFLPTGLTGAIGAAAALSKLFALDARATVCAMGIAAGSAGGLRETIGSMAAPFSLASTARNGTVAALLARSGLTAADGTLEGPKGLLATYGSPPNPPAATEGLGTRYELSINTYKPYPCGVWIHPTVDVCIDLAREHDIQSTAVEAVRLSVNERALAIAGRQNPTDHVQAQASLFHWAAAALLRRRATFAESEDGFVRDATTVGMRRRIAISANPGYGVEEASGEIDFTGGRMVKLHVRHCRGSLTRPLSDAELSEKFLDQVRTILPEAGARSLLDACWRIGQMDDAGALIRRFFPV